MPKRALQRLAHDGDAEPAERVLPARLPAVAPLAVLLLQDHDRARRVDDLPRADAAEVAAEQRRRLRVVVGHAEAAARVEVPAARRRASAGTNPMSCVSRSTELSVGCAMPILNLRGRYCSP